LALPVPPTRTGDDAPAPNRPRAMAAEHLRPLPPPPAAWPDPLRWLPSAEPNPRPRQDVRLSRYQFSNRSDDIRAIFCEYCDRVGVEWRRMNRWTISVARRGSGARMDRFIGPKR